MSHPLLNKCAEPYGGLCDVCQPSGECYFFGLSARQEARRNEAVARPLPDAERIAAKIARAWFGTNYGCESDSAFARRVARVLREEGVAE